MNLRSPQIVKTVGLLGTIPGIVIPAHSLPRTRYGAGIQVGFFVSTSLDTRWSLS
jgi:hypothetical protein